MSNRDSSDDEESKSEEILSHHSYENDSTDDDDDNTGDIRQSIVDSDEDDVVQPKPTHYEPEIRDPFEQRLNVINYVLFLICYFL